MLHDSRAPWHGLPEALSAGMASCAPPSSLDFSVSRPGEVAVGAVATTAEGNGRSSSAASTIALAVDPSPSRSAPFIRPIFNRSNRSRRLLESDSGGIVASTTLDDPSVGELAGAGISHFAVDEFLLRTAVGRLPSSAVCSVAIIFPTPCRDSTRATGPRCAVRSPSFAASATTTREKFESRARVDKSARLMQPQIPDS
eukprot:CAMPEP_0206299454 /NCGR_PEP_ID=MMETSP0106_2-20121207/7197_1 /ASSEMBLY_ACC=CAM_ASM_000206 /TAXON_ID=81532 /ORGANISM="Acanthoeca-like sp., Strain 10tr" /LENGTH=198 /DNA_ID=CAMNT_0053730153 /DNA_START=380 /DNA_END=972 /DNA_ORIENTATION=-